MYYGEREKELPVIEGMAQGWFFLPIKIQISNTNHVEQHHPTT
jgi:hypothetical protein